MFVIGAASWSRQSLTKNVGHGSREHYLFGEEEKSFLSSSSVTSLNVGSLGGGVEGLGCSSASPVRLKTALILSILVLKKSPKSFVKIV